MILLAALAALRAGGPWARVRQLKTGSELRLYRNGAVEPALARFGDVGGDALPVIVKNARTAIVFRISAWSSHPQPRM